MAGQIIFICVIAMTLGASFILVIEKRYRGSPNYKFLEITPPLLNDNQYASISLYYDVLHALLRNSGFRFWRTDKQLSLELVSERARGIRFIAVVPEAILKDFRSITAAHLPGVKTKEIGDYLDGASGTALVDSYRLKKSFVYPLSGMKKLELADPLDYHFSAMTKLSDGEVIATQLVLTSAAPRIAKRSLRRLQKAYQAVQKNGPVDYLTQSKYEQLAHKAQQLLFRARFSTLVISRTKTEADGRRRQINHSLTALRGEFDQRLIRQRIKDRNIFSKFSARYLGQLTNMHDLFSSDELSLVFHFPIRKISRTENLNRSFSQTLPAPVSLKNNTKLDILLGVNKHHGSQTSIGLTESERQRHIYIVGGTGNGKTTMLQYAIIQDIRAGKGLAVLDPHGDLAGSLLGYIPKHRIKDVIYFNPDDIAYPVGVNMLELPEGLSDDELIREKDLITESTISVMRKIFSDDDSGGHRIEYILRNTIQTALSLDEPTLFTIYDLLNDTRFRRKVVRELEDKDLKNFWRNELGKAGEFQRVKMAAGITAKVGRFLFSASAKRVLEQPKSTIDFDDIMNSGKILICNFSKGLLGEDTSTLFGTTVLAKLQMASLRRARIAQTKRRPFYLYVDEFQNFATMAFVQMLSEARKYKLYLTMAEQSTSQQDYQRLVDIILANVGTLICFRTGSPADERLLLPLFKPFIEQNEIPNLPAYNFYMRVAAVEAQEPFSGETVITDWKTNKQAVERVINLSRKNHARKYQTKKDIPYQVSNQKRLDLPQKPIQV